MRFSTLLLTAVMLSAAFAGCSGDKGPAVADFAATPLDAEKLSYKFDASNSSGSGLVYTWDFGDQSPPGTGAVVDHKYQYPNGEYTVKLTVVGSDGTTSEKVKKVQVGAGQNTAPVLYLSTDKRWVAPGESVTFDATQSFDADGDPIIFKWDFNDPREPADFNDMENLGGQQYGVYKYGPPPGESESGNGSEDAGDNGSLMLTPSGHDWAAEYAKAVRADEARKQLLKLVGVETFDGDHSVKPEPRAPGVDGKTSDTGPIQVFTFAEQATYFVYVQAVDIKGTVADGYIRINVDPNVPETSFTTDSTASLQPSATQELPIPGQEGAPQPWHVVNFTAEYPAVFEITLTHEPLSGSPAPYKVAGYVCAPGKTLGDCKSAPSQMAPWESGATLVYTVEPKPNAIGPLQVLFATMPDGTTPSGGADITVNIVGTIYPNKWFLEDSGNAPAH